MPITSSAACLPFTAIGTAVLQISISARDTQLPLQMPDIRLQANSCAPIVGQSLLAGGVHIRVVRLYVLHRCNAQRMSTSASGVMAKIAPLETAHPSNQFSEPSFSHDIH